MTGEEREQEQARPLPATQLFGIRLWLAELGPGESEWRGQLVAVATGEVRYFRDWEMLVKHLRELSKQASVYTVLGDAEPPAKRGGAP